MGVGNTKLRTGRLTKATTAMKVATSTFSGVNNFNTGSIADGTRVEVVLSATGAGSASIAPGAEFALPCGFSDDPGVNPADARLDWWITAGPGGTLLNVSGPLVDQLIVRFWVF